MFLEQLGVQRCRVPGPVSAAVPVRCLHNGGHLGQRSAWSGHCYSVCHHLFCSGTGGREQILRC